MDEGIKRRIEQRLEELGLSPRAASLKAGGSPDLIRGLLRGSQRSFRGENLKKVAVVLGVSMEWLQTGEGLGPKDFEHVNIVPIVGYVGAGSEAHYYENAHDPGDYAPIPPGVSLKSYVDLKAVEIRGDSLGSIYNGWLVYYDDVQHQPDSSMLKRLCVVGLKDGRVLVKLVMKGSAPGLYNLMSQTEGVIEDAEVSWAALVRAMAPR